MKWAGFNMHGRRPGPSARIPPIEMRSWGGVYNTYFTSLIFSVKSVYRSDISALVLPRSIKSIPVYIFAKQLHFRYRFQTQICLYFFSKFLILVFSNHQPNMKNTNKSTAAPPAIDIWRIMTAGSSLSCPDSRAIHIMVATNRTLKSKPKTHTTTLVSFTFSIFLTFVVFLYCTEVYSVVSRLCRKYSLRISAIQLRWDPYILSVFLS